jgi:hypothetical protein
LRSIFLYRCEIDEVAPGPHFCVRHAIMPFGGPSSSGGNSPTTDTIDQTQRPKCGRQCTRNPSKRNGRCVEVKNARTAPIGACSNSLDR